MKQVANEEKILLHIEMNGERGITNADLVKATGVHPHQQVFQITRRLKDKGKILGKRVGHVWWFFPKG